MNNEVRAMITQVWSENRQWLRTLG